MQAKGRLFGTSKSCAGPCIQASNLAQASATATFSSGDCRVLPPVGQVSSQIGELQDLFFGDLWERAPSVRVEELAQESCAA